MKPYWQRNSIVEDSPCLRFWVGEMHVDGLRFDHGLCLDLLVEGHVVVELKSIEKLAAVHFKQVLTYLRLLDLPVGLLINFGAATLKEGLHRIVHKYEPSASSPLTVNRTSGT